MKPSTIGSLIAVVEFFLIFFGASYFAPYLLTAECYEHSDRGHPVHPSFPIAIGENGNYAIVNWKAYEKSPEKYADRLILLPDKESYPLEGIEAFSISKTDDGNYKVTYHADNYTFWSEYSIVNGKVVPSCFRFSGAFVVMPVALMALLATLVINWVAKCYWHNRRVKTLVVHDE